MSKPEHAIRLEHISKEYRLYDSPKDRLKDALLPFGKRHGAQFMALDDVSLAIPRGETWGVIGLNGSGKSTLLKIVCRVTQPSWGELEVHGEVAALLELGAGFNPEFTGRQNVYFSGALAGFKRDQMDAMFDDIAKFADIGEFMDQPVKSYSSGMLVRLAFAVAISVNPDVLVIDEALAVGDAPFQHKCLTRIESFKGKSTILFVSHDMSAVIAFCDKVVWLRRGKVHRVGEPKKVVEEYIENAYAEEADASRAGPADWSALDSVELPPGAAIPENADSFGNREARILGARLYAADRDGADSVRPGEDLVLRVWIQAAEKVARPICGFLVRNRVGLEVFGYNNLQIGRVMAGLDQGESVVVDYGFSWPHLAQGSYSISVAIADGSLDNHEQLHWIHNALVVECVREAPITSILSLERPGFSVAGPRKD